MMAVLLALGVGWARYRFGSIVLTLAYIKGERLFVANPSLSLGLVEADRIYHVDFQLVNYTRRPVRVVGFATSCGCTTAQVLPVTISPSTTLSFPLEIKPAAGQVEPIALRLFTDDARKPELGLTIHAQTRAAKP